MKALKSGARLLRAKRTAATILWEAKHSVSQRLGALVVYDVIHYSRNPANPVLRIFHSMRLHRGLISSDKKILSRICLEN
jgi:hypothetical protein